MKKTFIKIEIFVTGKNDKMCAPKCGFGCFTDCFAFRAEGDPRERGPADNEYKRCRRCLRAEVKPAKSKKS